MNGDILTDLDFGSFLISHKNSGAAFSISSFSRVQKVDFGVLNEKNNFLEGFQEKPELKYEVSMGIYGVNRAVVETIPHDEPFGFDDLMLSCLERSLHVRVSRHEGSWFDIGRPEAYEKANESFTGK
jgi:NDP-sugar pyrophosphorylase family protein